MQHDAVKAADTRAWFEKAFMDIRSAGVDPGAEPPGKATMRSVVVPGPKKVDAILPNQMHHAMFLSQPSRPIIANKVLQPLGLADTGERISQNSFDQAQATQCGLPPLSATVRRAVVWHRYMWFVSPFAHLCYLYGSAVHDAID